METGTISIGGMNNMITDPTVMMGVGCRPLPRGVGHMRLDIEMIGTLIALGRGFPPPQQKLWRELNFS